MKRKNFRPKKRLGQNFLYDPAIARKIVAEASLAPGAVVVELGAGRGILTQALAEAGVRLIALEVDPPLFEELCQRFEGDGRVEIVHVDFTSVTLGELLAERGLERCTLMGNIPYNLTREVLFGFLVEAHESIDQAGIMMQKEVGDRIVSPPGSRVYGIPSVVLQSLYDVRVVTKVAPGSFTPRPKVASVVLEFKRLERELIEVDERRAFVELVRNVFQQRRKTLHNSLRANYSLSEDQFDRIHEATGLDLGLRPEALDKESFIALCRCLVEVSSS